jgi:hypothetical protein
MLLVKKCLYKMISGMWLGRASFSPHLAVHRVDAKVPVTGQPLLGKDY